MAADHVSPSPLEASLGSLRICAPRLAWSALPTPFRRGVVASAPLAVGDVALAVPAASLLSVLSPLSPTGDAALADFVACAAARQLGEDDALVLRLLLERAKGAASPWVAHVRLMPASYDLPFDYSDDELAALAGTGLHAVAVAMRLQARDDHAALVALLEGAGPAGTALIGALGGLDLASYIWALSTIWSRGVSLPLGEGSAPPGAPALGVVKVLAPGFDLCNHRPESINEHGFDASRQELVITVRGAPLAAGEQLLLNYGLHFSRDMIKLRGFVCVPEQSLPAHEAVQVQVSMPAGMPAFAQRAPLLRLYPPTGAHALLPAAQEEAGVLGTLADGTIFGAFELYEGVYNTALHRMVSVQLCASAALPLLRAALEGDRLANVDIQSELNVYKAIGEAVADMHSALGAPPDEQQLLAQLAAGEDEVGGGGGGGGDGMGASHLRRLQCAAHLRAVERRILRTQMALIASSIADLRAVVESFVTGGSAAT